MPDTKVYTNYDMQANRVRNASDAVLAQDYVTLAQLQAAVGSDTGYAQTFGDGSATSFVINHALATEDVVVAFREVATGNGVELGWSTNADPNNLTVTATPAPALNSLRVVIKPAA